MSFLPEGLLKTIHGRADLYDLENRFPAEDVDDLRDAGYLAAFVPTKFGGAGLTMTEICAEQTRLAKAAPATALAVNMHQIIVGVARHMVRSGDSRGEFVLRDAAAGELFAFGISEPGNDLVLFGSTTEAKTAPNGGYSFSGTKIFTSMAPAWSRLLTFGRWEETDEANAPTGNIKSVFAVLNREDGGFTVKNDWDAVGMRATQSNTTVLDGAVASADQILTVTDPGPSTDPVVFGIFANFELLLAATYMGVGLRAIEVAAEHVKKRRSVKNQNVYANDPDIRWRLADAAITMEGVGPQIRELAADFDEGSDLGDLWMPRLSAVKNSATESSLKAVEQSVRACGGASYFSKHELSRLYRDVLAGLFQPSDQESLHAAWANVVLGPPTS